MTATQCRRCRCWEIGMAKGFMPFDFLVDKGARFACEGNRVTVKREGDTLVVAHKRVPLLQVERLYDGAACRLRLFPTGDTTYHLASIDLN